MSIKAFNGASIREFLEFHGGMPEQATPVKEHARAKGYDYDSFRFACDDYMRGTWRVSLYRLDACAENPTYGCFSHVYTSKGSKPIERRPRRSSADSTQRLHPSSFVTQGNVEGFLKMQDGRCNCCEAILSRSGYHIDHIKPLKLGGVNECWNIQLLCPGCNMRKSAADPHKWASTVGISLPEYFLEKRYPFP